MDVPIVRVCAGNQGSEDACTSYFTRVCDDAVSITDAAAARGVKVAFEFPGGTLADTPDSAGKLYEVLNHQNIYALWQPLPTLDRAHQDKSLDVVLPRLAHVHVYHWVPGLVLERKPLADGLSAWLAWIERIAKSGQPHDYLLEFVPDNDPTLLTADATALRALLAVGS